ncbi:MAG: hypothetical protein PHQ34_12240 [Methanothrix sp.]|nr:hypothetical protein [Methanothrix sp.]
MSDFVEPTKGPCETVAAVVEAVAVAGHATEEAVDFGAVLAVFQDCFSVETE